MKLQYTPDPAGHAWQLTAEGLPTSVPTSGAPIWTMESIAR